MTAPLAPVPPPSPSFIRPAMALLAGLGITALIVGPGIVIATLAMLRGVDPRSFQPSPANLAVYLALNALGACVGGFATARITLGRSFYTVFLLALVLFMSALVVVLRGGEGVLAEPRWYGMTRALTVLCFALAGGALERRRHASRIPAS